MQAETLFGRARVIANGNGSLPRDMEPLVRDATVAVIDDDDDQREVLSRRLGRAGFRVQTYDDAEEALERMEQAPPDLIVLDLMMPRMNGWQFRLAQRLRPTLSEIPVVVTSGDNSPYAAAIDAAAYLTKPIDFDRLRNVVDQLLIATERRRLASKAMELERVRLLGMLVAGVAHEINNPLTYLLANLEIARRRSGERHDGQDSESRDAELRRSLDAASDGAKRIAFVVQLLSTFGRGEAAENSPVDPLRPLDAAIRLSMHHVDERAQLDSQLEACPYVRANESRLAQVFLNLLVNASQAIPPGSRRDHHVRVRAYESEGNAVIEISDTGAGISPEFLPRIFDNFFTTKPAGMGMGLGLSISRDIVQAVGGTITVQSQLGEGSTFRVQLPAAVRTPR